MASRTKKKELVRPEFTRDVTEYKWVGVKVRFNPVTGVTEIKFYPQYKLSCGHYQYENPTSGRSSKDHSKVTQLGCRACQWKADHPPAKEEAVEE